MTDTTATEPRPAVSTMTAKLKGDGPIELTAGEADELRATLRALFARDGQMLLRLTQLTGTKRVNICMAEALQKQGFVMKAELNPDGTTGWNLQTKAEATAGPTTVN